MKLDKDFVVKYQFWMLLGGGVLFIVMMIFVLLFVVPRSTNALAKSVASRWDAIKKQKDFKNELFLEGARAKAKIEEGNKDKVWQKAYETQKPLLTWPVGLSHFQNGLFATRVTVQGKDFKPPEPPKEEGAEQPKERTTPWTGLLQEFSSDGYIDVLGPDKKLARFWKTEKIQITGGDAKEGGAIDFEELLNRKGSYVTVEFYKGKYFGDELTSRLAEEQEKFANPKTGYASQLLPILKEAGPLNERNEPLVQFRGYPWDGKLPPPSRFFHYVPRWTTENRDISEEAWIAQEDLWIQREVFRLVKKANDYVAQFKAVPGGKDEPALWVNPYWQLQLELQGETKLNLVIKNNLPDRTQRLDARFVVQFEKDGPWLEIPRLDGEPLMPRGAKNDTHKQTLDLQGAAIRKGIFGVRQVLTWETAAVKRIDQISMGASGGEWSLAHRTAHQKLQPLKKSAAPPPPEEKKEGDGKMPPMPPVPGPDGRPGVRAAANLTFHELIRDRYLDVTPQARRVPVGVVLIVDQAHVARVQAAFADSALRFLTHQVLLHRYPHSVRPQLAGAHETATPGTPGFGMPKGGSARPPQPFFPPNMMGSVRGGGREVMPGPMPLPPMPGTYPPGSFPGDPTQTAGGGDEQESNVELVLYGVVSLYERYPPRAAEAAPKQ